MPRCRRRPVIHAAWNKGKRLLLGVGNHNAAIRRSFESSSLEPWQDKYSNATPPQPNEDENKAFLLCTHRYTEKHRNSSSSIAFLPGSLLSLAEIDK